MVWLREMRRLHLLLHALNLAASHRSPRLVVRTVKVHAQAAQVHKRHFGEHVAVELLNDPVHNARVHAVVRRPLHQIGVGKHQVQAATVLVDDVHHLVIFGDIAEGFVIELHNVTEHALLRAVRVVAEVRAVNERVRRVQALIAADKLAGAHGNRNAPSVCAPLRVQRIRAGALHRHGDGIREGVASLHKRPVKLVKVLGSD